MTSLTPGEAGDWLAQWAAALPQAIANAETKTANLGRANAILLCHGPYKTKLLRAMGHPYSRKDPHPPMPPWIINLQTGLFERSWFVLPMTMITNGTLVIVENTAPYSGFMRGTRKMIRRPIDLMVEQNVQNQRRVNLLAAVYAAMP